MSDFRGTSDRELIERYLAVCNEALRNSRNRFPFRQILEGLGQHAGEGRSVEVLIVNDQPAQGFSIAYDKNAQLVVPGTAENRLPPKKWKVTKSYLESVVGNPCEYIDNPAKIDWEWLHSLRVGETD